jgi:hypothetical protein
MAPRSCDSSTHASSSSGLMPLEAAISFGREPEYSTTHNSARRKRAGPRLNMGDFDPSLGVQLEMADLNDWFGNFNGESIGHEQGPADVLAEEFHRLRMLTSRPTAVKSRRLPEPILP